MSLRHLDRPRRAGLIGRLFAAFAASRVGRFVSRQLSWRLDPVLLRLTGGRVATTVIFPTALLETTGARSGSPRRNAVICFRDGDRYVAVASNAGSTRHPGWYHNLVAHPQVRLSGVPMVAEVVRDEAERHRLWGRAVEVFPAFDRYAEAAAREGRTIPVVSLAPAGSGPGSEGPPR